MAARYMTLPLAPRAGRKTVYCAASTRFSAAAARALGHGGGGGPRQRLGDLGLDAAPVGELVEARAFERASATAARNGRLCTTSTPREQVDLAHLLVIGHDHDRGAEQQQRASTPSQKAGKSGPLRVDAALGGARERQAFLPDAEADRARHRPLHRHGGEHRRRASATAGCARAGDRARRNARARPRRRRGSAASGSCPGWRCRRRRRPAPRQVEDRDHDADRFGAEPVEPAERELALLLAGQAARAGSSCRQCFRTIWKPP